MTPKVVVLAEILRPGIHTSVVTGVGRAVLIVYYILSLNTGWILWEKKETWKWIFDVTV